MGAKKRRQALRIPLSDSTNLTIPSTVLTLSTPFPVSRHANVFHAFNKDDPTSFSSPPPQSLNASSVHGYCPLHLLFLFVCLFICIAFAILHQGLAFYYFYVILEFELTQSLFLHIVGSYLRLDFWFGEIYLLVQTMNYLVNIF